MKKGFTPHLLSIRSVLNYNKDNSGVIEYKKGAGFTLVEILVAIFILGLGMVTLFNLFPLGLQSFSYARKLNGVYFLAEKKLEELKLQPSMEPVQISGEEKDLQWKISTKTLKLPEGIEVIYAELEIDFTFQARAQKQRFITYLSANQ